MSFVSSWLSDRGDSNSRPLRPERSTLPTALLSECNVIKALASNCSAKIRISERNAKEKLVFLFISKRKYFRDIVSKIRISERNAKEKPVFLFISKRKYFRDIVSKIRISERNAKEKPVSFDVSFSFKDAEWKLYYC